MLVRSEHGGLAELLLESLELGGGLMWEALMTLGLWLYSVGSVGSVDSVWRLLYLASYSLLSTQ